MGTKEKILEVALDVFSEVGYEGTTTREICKRAEVNVAALNYHWGSKERLWQESCNWAGKVILEQATRNLGASTDPKEFITRTLGEFFDAFRGDSRPIRIITWASLQADYMNFNVLADESFQPAVKFAMQYLEKLAADGIIADIDYEVFLSVFWGQYLVAFLDEPGHRLFFGADFTDEKLAARFRKTLIDSALTMIGLQDAPRRKKKKS